MLWGKFLENPWLGFGEIFFTIPAYNTGTGGHLLYKTPCALLSYHLNPHHHQINKHNQTSSNGHENRPNNPPRSPHPRAQPYPPNPAQNHHPPPNPPRPSLRATGRSRNLHNPNGANNNLPPTATRSLVQPHPPHGRHPLHPAATAHSRGSGGRPGQLRLGGSMRHTAQGDVRRQREGRRQPLRHRRHALPAADVTGVVPGHGLVRGAVVCHHALDFPREGGTVCW